MKIESKYEYILESLEWGIVGEDLKTIDIESWSPAGENIILTLNTNDIPGSAMSEYENFDVDEHAAELIANRGENGIPDSVWVIAEDAYKIRDMLKELAYTLLFAE